jgi:hypothetical protein
MMCRYHRLLKEIKEKENFSSRPTVHLKGKDSLVIFTLGLFLLQLGLVDNFISSQYLFGVIK